MWIRRYVLALWLLTLNVVVLAQALKIDSKKYHSSKETICSKGAVVSAHPLASQSGLLMLQQGGNAFDAAIATQLSLAVVYPGAGNIGGGGFMVAHMQNGDNISIDYRETAPAAASKDMYLDANGNAQLQLSQFGPLSSGVPGTVAGLFEMHKYAKLDFKKLIAPAIDLAENGFALTAREAKRLNGNRRDFQAYNNSPVAFVKETQWKEGDLLIQPELAKTLKRIRDNGKAGFYEGETADLIVNEMRSGNGIITREDLKDYRVKKRDVLTFNYKGYKVVTMPLPSSGGIILCQVLGMIEDKNIASKKFQTVSSVQLMTEAERRSFADRAEYMGDPDFVKVPVNVLTSKKYIKQRMADYKPDFAGSSNNTKAGVIKESEETTHLNVFDRYGNAIAVTTTLNGNYGSSTVVAGAGFLLNNEMDDFSVKPGVANMYGAIGNAKNAIAPGKRMLSSMTPTIILKEGKPYIITGTPGGTTIPTSVFQTIVNLLDFKLSANDAVNKPKFHHQWRPDTLYVEKTFPKDVQSGLSAIGYKLVERDEIGRTELIVIEKKRNGKLQITAVADKRGDDSAAGF